MQHICREGVSVTSEVRLGRALAKLEVSLQLHEAGTLARVNLILEHLASLGACP